MFARFLLVTVLLLSLMPLGVTSTRYVLAKNQRRKLPPKSWH